MQSLHPKFQSKKANDFDFMHSLSDLTSVSGFAVLLKNVLSSVNLNVCFSTAVVPFYRLDAGYKLVMGTFCRGGELREERRQGQMQGV